MREDRRRLIQGVGAGGPKVPNYFYVQNETDTAGQIWFGSRGTLRNINIEYSTDLENWTSKPNISTSERIPLPASGKVYFRGSNTAFASAASTWRWIQCDVLYSVGGRLEYLLDPSGVPANVTNSTFCGFFRIYNQNNTTLIDASKLTLKDIPGANEYYRAIFRQCTALTKGPYIDIATVPTRGLQECFYLCSALAEVKCTATNVTGSYAMTNWMNGVPATGTFYKNAAMNSWPRNINGIPAGWTVVDL